MVDFGCMAPTVVFIEVFKTKGIELTMEEARGPMGMAKIDHVRKLTQIERVVGDYADLINLTQPGDVLRSLLIQYA